MSSNVPLIPFEKIKSRIAGVNSGDEAETRQDALRRIREWMEEHPNEPVWLDLVRDPDNPYDPENAIQVMCNVPDLGLTQLGFVRNADNTCQTCDRSFSRFPEDGRCPRCGSSDLERIGLAKKLRMSMDADPDLYWFGRIMEVTGGNTSKGKPTYGANVMYYPKRRKCDG